MIRYLMDEHIPKYYRTHLLNLEPTLEVWAVGDTGAPSKGTLDPDILCWCEEHNFILVTNNRKSMPAHLAEHLAAGRHVPGILTIDLQDPIRVVTEFLAAIAGASYEDEYRDTIAYVP